VNRSQSISEQTVARGTRILSGLHRHLAAAASPDDIDIPYNDLSGLVEMIEDDLVEVGSEVVSLAPCSEPEDYFYVRPMNIAAVSVWVARKAGLARRTTDIGLGALLCDIGFALIRESPISDREMQRHPEYGLRILRLDSRFTAWSRAIVFQHHERHDGSGYPRKLQGEGIDPLSRIVSVADTYCSLVSSGNPSGARLGSQEAFEYVMSAAGFEFDHTTVLGVMQYVAPYPVGTVVRLNTGETAVVTRVFKGLTTRPNVRVIADRNGREVCEADEMVLADSKNQTTLITEICDL
jgi:HD-GYP domain-containing protein (c-di-GMP phosphodiesterase class II)